MFHPDVRKRRIQKTVSEYLPNIKNGSEEIRQHINKYSRLLIVYWLLFCAAVIYGFIYYSTVYTKEYSVFNHYPRRMIKKKVTNLERYSVILFGYIIAATLGYSTLLPFTIGIYVAFHVWAQFCLLNDYLKSTLWEKNKYGELCHDQDQIYENIKEVVQWHHNIKR